MDKSGIIADFNRLILRIPVKIFPVRQLETPSHRFHEISRKNLVRNKFLQHSVEILVFLCHSDREINFEDSRSAKTAGFAILEAVNFVHMVNFCLQNLQKIIKINIQNL